VAEGTVSSQSIYVGDHPSSILIWGDRFDFSTNTTIFNWDGQAVSSLEIGKQYNLYLHSYDENLNQATTFLTFYFQEFGAPEIGNSYYQYVPNWNFLAWISSNCNSAYRLYWGTESGVTKQSEYAGQTTTPWFRHTGVIGGWTYYYKIAAVDINGNESELSEEKSVAVPTYPLEVPFITSVNYNGSGSNFISWTTVPGPVEYKIYWGTSTGVDTGSEKLTPTTNNIYEHPDIQSGNTYCYRVTSANRYNESNLSNEFCVNVP